MISMLIDEMFQRTLGIALVRPIAHAGLQERLQKIWAGQDPEVSIMVGGISTPATDMTADVIMMGYARKTTGTIDLLHLAGTPAQNANRLIMVAHRRMIKMLKEQRQPDRLNILIAFIAEEALLGEIARCMMEAQNRPTSCCDVIATSIDRPGDGVVMAYDGNIIGVPVIPRDQMTVTAMAEA